MKFRPQKIGFLAGVLSATGLFGHPSERADWFQVKIPYAAPITCPLLLASRRPKMKSLRAFNRAIRAEGKNGTVRQATADFIDETFPEYADRTLLIQIQNRFSDLLERYGAMQTKDLPKSKQEEGLELQATQKELLTAYGTQWIPHIPGVSAYWFNRGMVSGAVVDHRLIVNSGTKFAKVLDKLIDFGIDQLEVENFFDPEAILTRQHRLSTPKLEFFSELTIPDHEFTALEIADLTENSHLKNMRRLSLTRIDWELPGPLALYSCSQFAGSDVEFSESCRQVRDLNPTEASGLPFELRRDLYFDEVQKFRLALCWRTIRERFPSSSEQKKIGRYLYGDGKTNFGRAHFKNAPSEDAKFEMMAKFYSFGESDGEAYLAHLVSSYYDFLEHPVRLAFIVGQILSKVRRDISDEGLFAQALIRNPQAKVHPGLRGLAYIYERLNAQNQSWNLARDQFLRDTNLTPAIKADYLRLHVTEKNFDDLMRQIPIPQRDKTETEIHLRTSLFNEREVARSFGTMEYFYKNNEGWPLRNQSHR